MRWAAHVALVAILAGGCVKYQPVDLTMAMPAPEAMPSPRACALTVAGVVDERPDAQRRGDNERRFKFLMPLVIWVWWIEAGATYTKPDLYAKDLHADLHRMLSNLMVDSTVCSGSGDAYTLTPVLRHYYGVAYMKTDSSFAAGSSWNYTYQFWPTGQVGLDLVLSKDGTEVGRTHVSERYLMNPEDGLTQPGAARFVGMDAARIALKRLLERVPLEVDRLLAGQPGLEVPASADRFLVVRLTREYDFEEHLWLDSKTGQLYENRVVRRTLPVLGAPDEWLVAPVSPQGRWLSPTQYDALVQALQAHWRVGFTDNLTAASFEGPVQP